MVRGETYHFEVVSNDSCRAVMEVQLATGVPIANGILTTENDDQAPCAWMTRALTAPAAPWKWHAYTQPFALAKNP